MGLPQLRYLIFYILSSIFDPMLIAVADNFCRRAQRHKRRKHIASSLRTSITQHD